ncbi:ABC transporter substrate-binding protein [Streptomyces zingiberis]|uniref:Sugar ABC transporter substrate-binding protein n=1 Tax=Streptomyces zingiberis TaxID=2053010 RepID=A0ABX1C0F0_9ACTN|nr:sugar ABC transporter substrate-binding protein [Streptomyces zingiberis]NJQ00379.1 sugar ABC transporter substrate-binding protein [Streptomyces zingiberis]
MPGISDSTWDRRGVLRAAGGLAALGALSACGSNTGRGGGGSGTSIKQMYHAYGEPGTQQAARKFAKAYPKADVSVQWIPGEFEKKLFTALLSSDAPDVFEFHPQIHLAHEKQIVPLDDILKDVKDDFNQADLASHTIDGKIYGVRMIDDPQFLFYRKSMLKKAGLKPPETLDELIDAAEKLTTGKVKGLYLGQTLQALQSPLVWSTGADLLTPKHEIGYHTDEVVAALRKMRRLYAGNALLKGAPTDFWDPASFTQGLCAMQWCGMWAMPQILQAHGDDVGIMPWPSSGGPGGRPVVYNGGWSAFVSSKAKDVDAAKEFVKWLWIDQKEYQREWALDYGFHIPPRKSVAADADKLKSGLAAEGVKLFEEDGLFDDPAWTQSMITTLTDVMANAVRGDADPDAELDKADRKINRELRRIFG